MGKLLIFAKYVLFVFSSDINEKRRHVHVRDKEGKMNRLCKLWIEPIVELAYNYGFSRSEINEIRKLVSENKKIINSQLKLFYAGQKVKSIIAE